MKVETLTYTSQGWSEQPKIQGNKNSLVIVFGASKYLDNSTPFQQLKEIYPQSLIVGCSTSGEILGSRIYDGSLVVAALHFASTRVAVEMATVSSAADSFDAGDRLAKSLLAPDLRGVLVFSDGLNVNGSELVRGLRNKLPAGVLINGGLAGDADRFQQTWVLAEGLPARDKICAVGLYGEKVRVGYGSMGGWDIFGPARQITKSEGNVLYELDGSPALALYKKYLGDRANELPSAALLFPLSVRETMDADKSLVRTILNIDEDKQSMTFAGDVPQGHYAQLMKANLDNLVEGAARAGEQARIDGTSDTLALAISCVGRRLVLGERAEEETEAVLQQLGTGASLIGFYSYGEISPTEFSACDLHNQTMTLATITELQ